MEKEHCRDTIATFRCCRDKAGTVKVYVVVLWSTEAPLAAGPEPTGASPEPSRRRSSARLHEHRCLHGGFWSHACAAGACPGQPSKGKLTGALHPRHVGASVPVCSFAVCRHTYRHGQQRDGWLLLARRLSPRPCLLTCEGVGPTLSLRFNSPRALLSRFWGCEGGKSP